MIDCRRQNPPPGFKEGYTPPLLQVLLQVVLSRVYVCVCPCVLCVCMVCVKCCVVWPVPIQGMPRDCQAGERDPGRPVFLPAAAGLEGALCLIPTAPHPQHHLLLGNWLHLPVTSSGSYRGCSPLTPPLFHSSCPHRTGLLSSPSPVSHCCHGDYFDQHDLVQIMYGPGKVLGRWKTD